MKADIHNAFQRIQADDALISGTEHYLKEELKRRQQRRHTFTMCKILPTLSLSLATLLLFVGIFAWRSWNSAEAVVALDINPSIALTLNRLDRVIESFSYNSDGEALLREAHIGGRTLQEALALLLAEAERVGYLTADGLVALTVQTANVQREQALCGLLWSIAEESLASKMVRPALEIFPVTQEIQVSAHGHRMTPAKYLTILDLIDLDASATLEAYGGSSIGQIRQRIRECRHNQGIADEQRGGISGYGHGHRRGHH